MKPGAIFSLKMCSLVSQCKLETCIAICMLMLCDSLCKNLSWIYFSCRGVLLRFVGFTFTAANVIMTDFIQGVLKILL